MKKYYTEKYRIERSNVMKDKWKNPEYKKNMVEKHTGKKYPDELKKQGIKFIPQYEWEKGFIDIFIPPNIAIFADGTYWHNLPKQKQKDVAQDREEAIKEILAVININVLGLQMTPFGLKQHKKEFNKGYDFALNKVCKMLKEKLAQMKEGK